MSKELEKKLEIANKIIDRLVDRYEILPNGKEPQVIITCEEYTFDESLKKISKEQYDYIKELKENGN